MSLAIFSSARCPAAFLTVTLQSCDRLRGVSETRNRGSKVKAAAQRTADLPAEHRPPRRVTPGIATAMIPILALLTSTRPPTASRPKEGPAEARSCSLKAHPDAKPTRNSEHSCSALFPAPFTESQNVQGWKGPLWVTQSNPPAEAGSPRAGCAGPCLGGS